MRKTRKRRHFAAAVLAVAGAATAAPHPALGQPACPGDLDGATMAVSGRVVEVGDDGFSQYMTILDDSTGCRVVIFVADDADPCPYGQRASITLSVSKSTYGDVDYIDSGGTEPYDCP